MPTTPTDTPADGSPGKSRLDRELEEILSRNENIRLLPPPPKPARTRAPAFKPPQPLNTMLPSGVKHVLGSPLVVALGLAIAALLLADVSALVATVLCTLAVVCVILPMIQRFRRPTSAPETRMWRGRVIEPPPPTGATPLSGVREWWRSLKQ